MYELCQLKLEQTVKCGNQLMEFENRCTAPNFYRKTAYMTSQACVMSGVNIAKSQK